ncbi:TfoX domain protein [Rubellimicrobium mesophilum DSM 19309]|uniref:TfoX domain protein n=1 Tax=Rubellimicrobium mesophilum DSM 19309 TaxID=442562 RepID=A0A017HTR1_9RHOB|nr:TfoX/Sxy family protein [Rubellimicrobium mesophilum]EYD77887.1 TfoX domain protein [Rubellimicrobium mesophilum DSM 19309]
MAAISSLRNMGPASEAAFRKVGISTAEELRDLGADAAYARLLEAGERPHFIGYYVIHMALQGRPWNDCKGAEKVALRERFDALKARHCDPGLTRVEAELDMFGVGLRR